MIVKTKETRRGRKERSIREHMLTKVTSPRRDGVDHEDAGVRGSQVTRFYVCWDGRGEVSGFDRFS